MGTVIIGLLVGTFGVWRLASGFSYLGWIERRVPGRDHFDRYLPDVMKASDPINGMVDLIGGFMFTLAGIAAVVSAF